MNCVGACAMAPVVMINEQYYGKTKPTRVKKYLAKGGDDEN